MFSASLARRGNFQTKHHKDILSIGVILQKFTKIVVRRFLFTNNLLAGQLHSSPGADEYYQTLETFEIFLNVLESTDPFPVFTLSYATYSSRMKLGIARVSSKHPMLWFCQNKRIIKGRNSQKTCLKNVGNGYRTNTPIVLQKSQISRFLPFSHVCQ